MREVVDSLDSIVMDEVLGRVRA